MWDYDSSKFLILILYIDRDNNRSFDLIFLLDFFTVPQTSNVLAKKGNILFYRRCFLFLKLPEMNFFEYEKLFIAKFVLR